jgi:hypothetical protein
MTAITIGTWHRKIQEAIPVFATPTGREHTFWIEGDKYAQDEGLRSAH